MRDAIRKELIASYKHRPMEGVKCVVCDRSEVPFALHVVQFYHADNIVTPLPLVPMSQSLGTRRGGVPLCDACCPPCNICSLPIATLWTKKIVTALGAHHQEITFNIGVGFCRHIHILHDLRSLIRSVELAGLPVTPPADRLLSKNGYEWRNKELSIYFDPKPKDPIWKAVTNQIAEIIQEGFLEIWQELKLDQYSISNPLPHEALCKINEIANRIGEKHNLNTIFILIITHQYVDADPLIRQIHRNRWVASMVNRLENAQPPETYIEYIQATYRSDN